MCPGTVDERVEEVVAGKRHIAALLLPKSSSLGVLHRHQLLGLVRNVGKANAEACTTVLVPGLKVVKTGTKEQFLTRTATYEIRVSNTGDTTLTGVVVTDTAPEGTTVTGARRQLAG